MEEKTELPIRFLKGVGEKRALLYHKLGIDTAEELLRYYPRAYLDFSKPQAVASAPYDQCCAVLATVLAKGSEQRIRKGMSLYKMKATDGVSDFSITFFNSKYTVDALQTGEEYFFYGKLGGRMTKREMTAPMVLPYDPAIRLLPIYPLTAGISNKVLSQQVQQALERIKDSVEDPLPDALRQHYELCHAVFALCNIHRPDSEYALESARKRLIFEELLILSLAMAMLRTSGKAATGAPMKPMPLDAFFAALPFEPTGAQRRVIAECTADLCAAAPMNRLIQGDVGCGKTLVGAACAFFAHQNGWQTAMMAPTEILAEQHHRTLTALLAPYGMRVGLLTGSMKAAQKREVKQALAQGDCDFVIGTHALLQDTVEFSRLGLVITDEQHRFGVAQRLTLSQKGRDPHVLVMSATPIPRTLAFIIYGDLDLSVIDELPRGRQPVKTYVIRPALRHRANAFLHKHLEAGEQAYIVCPLVEEGEVDLGLESAQEVAERAAREEFSDCSVGLLHGRMKPGEKDKVMRAFAAGTIQLLVATTVIEVGVDVPNATMMMIENAERFGLSQLHQLRGRIGRGRGESHCILVSESDAERLQVIAHSADGFHISEEDLKLRGPGDFFGSRQHGLPQLRIAELLTDRQLLQQAQQACAKILSTDSRLARPEHRLLRREVRHMLGKASG